MKTSARIAVIGTSGAIGLALYQHFIARGFEVIPLSRANTGLPNWLPLDLTDEDSISHAAATMSKQGALDKILLATGILHGQGCRPEKALKQITRASLEQNFAINTIGPTLVAKHFLPKLPRDRDSFFGVLSARVGSTSDNKLGGWYSYRAAKAAVNMVIKSAAIEMARTHKRAIIAGLHPGTVDSNLSKPFQPGVPEGKLFTPEYSAQCLARVIEQLTPADSGKVFAWDGQEIAP